MKTLWAPWRLSYIEGQEKPGGCIFCDLPARTSREERRDGLVLAADDHAAVLMNRYPYAHAHLMVAPRRHTADFAGLEDGAARGVQRWLQRSVRALEAVYGPRGFNIGANLGRAGGAGIADHLHWHVVPQHIEEAYDRLLPQFS